MLERKIYQLTRKLGETKRWLHYRAAISSEEHRKAIDRTGKLAGDFVAFLEQSKNLKALGLDREQVKVVSTIVEGVKDGSMKPNSPEVRYDGFPRIIMRYGNYQYEITHQIDIKDGTHVVLGLTYNLETNLPTKSYFFGFDNFFESFITHDVYFMFSPNLITEDSIRNIIEQSWLKQSKITTSENRVLVEWERPRLGESSTSVYNLLGQIEYDSLEQPLFVYGHNSTTSKTFGMKIPEPATEHFYASNK